MRLCSSIRVRAGLVAVGAAALLALAPSALGAAHITGTVAVTASDDAVAAAIDKAKLCVSGYGWDDSGAHVVIAEQRVNPDGSYGLDIPSAGTYGLHAAACADDADAWDANVLPSAEVLTGLADMSTLDLSVAVAGAITGSVASSWDSSLHLDTFVCVSAWPDPSGSDLSGAEYGVYNQPLQPGSHHPQPSTYALRGLVRDVPYIVAFSTCPVADVPNRVAPLQIHATAAEASTAASAASATPANVRAQPAPVIKGVVKQGGRGLSGICVNARSTLGPRSGRIAWATTLARGAFSVKGLVPGTYDVWFYAGRKCRGRAGSANSNVVPYLQSNVVLTGGADKDMGTIQMAVGGTISGTVTQPGGEAAADICVSASEPATTVPNMPKLPSRHDTTTTADGTYTLKGLTAGTYTVSFSLCGVAINGLPGDVSGVSVALGKDTTGIDFAIPVGATVTGHVRLGDGSAAEGICVSAQRRPYDPSPAAAGFATTGADGDYTIQGLLPGTYDLAVYACSDTTQGLVGSDDSVAVAVGKTSNAGATVMRDGARITGTVRTPGGDPAPAVAVWATSPAYRATGGSSSFAETNANGDFTLAGLLAGDYVLSYADWSGSAVDGITVSTTLVHVGAIGTTVQIPSSCTTPALAHCAQFHAGVSISGTVTGLSGEPVPSACVSVHATSFTGEGDLGAAVTDGSGGYKVDGLKDGESYVLYVDPCWQTTGRDLAGQWYASGLTRASADEIALSGSATGKDVQLGLAGSIAGTVTQADGSGVGGVCVDAFSVDQLATPYTAQTPLGRAVTNSSGAYAIGGLVPSATDYRVAFQPCSTDTITTLRQQWFNGRSGATSPAGATVVAVSAGAAATADATLGAWAADSTPTCNPLLFPAGDCSAAALYVSPAVAPDIGASTGGVVAVTSPSAAVEVDVSQDMLNTDATIGIDPSAWDDPANSADPPPSIGGASSSAITPYIGVHVDQGGAEDSGGNWAVPLEIVIAVPGTAVGIPDEQLPVYFDESSTTPWQPIPYVGAANDDETPPELAAGVRDGYWVKGAGADREIHVLTRHASTYAVFRKKTAQSLATVRAKVRKGTKLKLPATSLQGLALRWTSSTKSVCTVAKSKKGAWTLTAKRAGTCSIKGANRGSTEYLAASFKKRLKVTAK